MPGAPNASPPIEHIQLDRAQHANFNFNSWTLRHDILKSQDVIPLETQVPVPAMEEMDYIHARYEALHNHITSQPRYTYFFQSEPGAALQLCTLEPASGFDAICALEPPPLPDTATGLVSSKLYPSVAEIVSAATDTSTASAAPQLLVSSGAGDLRLVTQQLDAEPVISDAVFPLRPTPPLQGVRPLHLEAAFTTPTGAVVAVCWAVGRVSEGGKPAVCQVYAVTLQPLLLQLQVVNIQLLKTSSMPPHGVLVNPYESSILIALDPKDDGPSNEGGDYDDEGMGTLMNVTSNSAGGAVDDADDPVSPRTLRAAVERLEQYTSDEPNLGVPREGYADLFHESGPDNVGAMGSEPTVALLNFTWREQGNGYMQCEQHMSCLPHRLLTCQLHQNGTPQGCLLLGLSDDVDCAVIEIQAAAPADHPTSHPPEHDDGGADREGLPSQGFEVKHTTSIPALAYVAAGKMAKKFFLITPLSCSTAAALVESRKYAYLYKRTLAQDAIGCQQVVEMDLPGQLNKSSYSEFEAGCGSGVLGAVALPWTDGSSVVMLLTSTALLKYKV